MATTPTTSAYAQLYLPAAGQGPAPVFRDLSPDAVSQGDGTCVPWPHGAVFAVTFPANTHPAIKSNKDCPFSVFFDTEGWPIGFPARHRSRFAPAAKRAFQYFPFHWQRWEPSDYACYGADGGDYLIRLVANRRIGRPIAHLLTAEEL